MSTELNTSVIIDANKKFSFQNSSNILIENIADAITYRKEGVQSKTSDSMVFHLDISDHFLDRNVYLNRESTKVEFTFTTPELIGSYTEFNANGLLDNVCLKESGLINCVKSIQANLDGELFNSSDTNKTFKVISPYWEKKDITYATDASLPDPYYSYKINDGANWIPTRSTDGSFILIKAPKLNDKDPFNATVDTEYNSRQLQFTVEELKKNATHITGMVVDIKNLTMLLPFVIFSSYGDESPIYNGSKISLTVNMESLWINHLFSMRPNDAGNNPFSVRFLPDEGVGANIIFRLYRPPTAILDKLDTTKSYIRSRALCELDNRSQDVIFKEKDHQVTINTSAFDCKTVPKRIYIALMPKNQTEKEILTSTNHFCRFDSLSVELFGTRTVLGDNNDSEKIYHICKENGLQMNKNALYVKGFPVCLDVSNNIAYAGNNFVGISRNSSGKYTVRMSGTATRLHTDALSFGINDFPEGDARGKNIYKEKTYELVVVFVYSTFFVYNMFGKKFSTLESLSVDNLASLGQSIDDLYANFVPHMDVIGGSALSVIGDAAKSVGKGIWNVVKATWSNKNGLRDNLYKAYQGGNSMDSHVPLMGGNSYAKSSMIAGSSNNLMNYRR